MQKKVKSILHKEIDLSLCKPHEKESNSEKNIDK